MSRGAYGLLWLALAVVCSIGLLGSHANACECVHWESLAEEVDRSTYVFQGVVASVELDEEDFFYQIEFDVVQRWKGSISETMVLYTYADEGMCGIGLLRRGAEYLVFTGDGRWADWIDGCGSTLRVDWRSDENNARYAENKLAELAAVMESAGRGVNPDAKDAVLGFPNSGSGGLGSESRPGPCSTDASVVSGVALVVAVGACWMVWRRQRGHA